MTQEMPSDGGEDAGRGDVRPQGGEAGASARPNAESDAARSERDGDAESSGREAPSHGDGTADRTGSEDEADSDSDRIARIDAYVRNQRREENDWLGKLATYIGLAAFFFGIGTFADLRHHFSESDRTAAAAKTGVASWLDTACHGGNPDGRPSANAGYATLAAYDKKVLFDRDAVNYAWASDTSELSDADAETYLALRHSYFAASNFLAAAISAAQAQDARGYAVSIGQYNEAESQFLKESAEFGLASGTCSWGVPDAPNVTVAERNLSN